MGSSSSKAVRKLPTTSSSVLRTKGAATPAAGYGPTSTEGVSPSTPPNGGNPAPNPTTDGQTSQVPPEGKESDPLMEAPNYLEQGLGGETRAPSSQPGAQGGSGLKGDKFSDSTSDKGLARGGMGRVEFSGAKDDAIRRDAMDPQFMNNLSRLGQVKIHDAGEFIPAQAQRTLASRSSHPEFTAATQSYSAPPVNHLTITLLVSLLDRLKSLAPGSDALALYKEFGVDKSVMDDVRKWVNSVSVAETDEIRVEDGEEVREMKAVWVGGLAK
ncbi:uncharacterized protein IL334_002369 [Kwoniella shivajii]|uniref:Uncharacterized protein n=1 Tax=Kwoniella shivajii TaxID=564305 RepID=A0ABZ1CUK0_9TREE|nr:hypothetical protein IL334_002369 [Kwoniella shivajii]